MTLANSHALAAALIAALLIPTVAMGQDAERCGCRYANAESTLSGSDLLCYRSESIANKCSLDWAPPRGSRVIGSAFPRGTQDAVLQLLQAAAITRDPRGDPIVAAYGRPEFWRSVIGIAVKYGSLQGEPTLEDSIGAFLSSFESLSDFKSEAIGGILYLTASALVRMKMPQLTAQEILRQLFAREKDLISFLTKGRSGPLELPITINIPNGPKLLMHGVVNFGCFEVRSDNMRVSIMIKPGWGEGRRDGVCRT